MKDNDYSVGPNGENISRIVKDRRIEAGLKKFNQLKERFDLQDCINNNNIISFKHNDKEYYYAVVKKKIRLKGSKDWTTSLISILK